MVSYIVSFIVKLRKCNYMYCYYYMYYGCLGGARFGVGLVIERSRVRLPVGALSSQLGQLSLPSLGGRQIEYQPALAGVRRGAFTCVG